MPQSRGLKPEAGSIVWLQCIAEIVRTMMRQFKMSRVSRNLAKVVRLQMFGWLFLTSQIVLAANGADQPK
jgi:hypothetical protein